MVVLPWSHDIETTCSFSFHASVKGLHCRRRVVRVFDFVSAVYRHSAKYMKLSASRTIPLQPQEHSWHQRAASMQFHSISSALARTVLRARSSRCGEETDGYLERESFLALAKRHFEHVWLGGVSEQRLVGVRGRQRERVNCAAVPQKR